MKKLTFVLCTLSLCSFFGLSAKETVVWTGNEPISWNTEVYAGTQFETPKGIFAGLQKDYLIKVVIVPGMDEPQYVMTYKAGESWNWTDLAITVKDSIMSYTVETNSIATEIADRGLIFRGQGYNITSILVDDLLPDTVPSVDPQPGDTTGAPAVPGAYEAVVWQGTPLSRGIARCMQVVSSRQKPTSLPDYCPKIRSESIPLRQWRVCSIT